MRAKVVLCLCMMLASVSSAAAFTANSSNFVFDFTITGGAVAEIGSANFKTYPVVGDVASTANSSNFKTDIGFTRTTYYLNGEACSIDAECASAVCCNGVCQSGACAVDVQGGGGAGGGGGGGGGGIPSAPAARDFGFDKKFLKFSIKQGQVGKDTFEITNTGTEALRIRIEYPVLQGIVLQGETEFGLEPGQGREINVTVFVEEGQKPDVYAGNILVEADGVRKSLPLIIEVRAKKALFDISARVLPGHKYILRNGSAAAKVTLANTGDLKPVDVQLHYSVKGLDNREIVSGLEILAVYNKVSTTKELELPENISLGVYVFYAKVSYGAETAVAGEIFYVVDVVPETCDDELQNQGEKKVDCGGPCNACPSAFSLAAVAGILQKGLLLISLPVAILIAWFLLILLLKKRRKREKRSREAEIVEKADRALMAGHSTEMVRRWLLSKGVGEKTVDKALRIVMYRDEILTGYISKTLDLGHSPEAIRRALVNAGWPKRKVDHYLSKYRY